MRFTCLAGRHGVELDADGLRGREILSPVGRYHTDEMRLLQELLIRKDGALPVRLKGGAQVLAIELEDDAGVLQEVLAEDEELEAARTRTRRQRLFANFGDTGWLCCK